MTEVPQRPGAESKIATVVRMRALLVVAALLLPLALYGFFEHQARRLEALAAHGEPVDARVTGIAGRRATTSYTYRVGGTDYTSNAPSTNAPFGVGEVFPATYLPEDPSLSRPYSDRSLASIEVARNRSFAWMACSAIAVFFLTFAGFAHLYLGRLRAGDPSELGARGAAKSRLQFAALALLPLSVSVFAFDFEYAGATGQSVVPVIAGLVLSAGAVGGVIYFVTRGGPNQPRMPVVRAMRWFLPIVLGIALLGMLALSLGFRP